MTKRMGGLDRRISPVGTPGRALRNRWPGSPTFIVILLTCMVVTGACAVSDDGARPAASAPPEVSEILWDTWGVPHVYGRTDADVFRGLGRAQMRSHGNLILRLYGEARGRAAEYWGEEHLGRDRLVHTLGVPERAQEHYEAQPAAFRDNLDAFAAGMNEFADEHPDRLAPEVRSVLPVTGRDVLAHTLWAIHYSFVGGEALERGLAAAGSNAWAIAPSRSASGHAMLLANPHLAWRGAQLFYEAHVVGPGIDFYGTTLVGFPVLALGFNERLGWTHTVNTFDGADVYVLDLAEGGYRYDGEVRPFESRTKTLTVRTAEGERQEELSILRSVHGPVLSMSEERATAVRIVGLDAPGMLRQWWDMSRARDLEGFEAALARLQVPMFNVLYADADGHVMYVFNGRVPVRSEGDWSRWSGPVAGDTSATLWDEVHPYEELPRILDPDSGWLQNANDPPWTATFPRALDPASFPPYMAPRFMHWRAQRSAVMLRDDASVSFEELLEYKHSTRMLLADRLLDDLLAAVADAGSDRARRAAEVLSAWDRSTDADSRGAVLYEAWAERMQFPALFGGGGRTESPGPFAVGWSPDEPLATPDGLADPARAVEALDEAARRVEELHGAVDVPWGQVYRAVRGDHDVPANGGPGDPGGIFRVVYFAPDASGGGRAVAGDTFYAAVEFGEPLRARVLLAYGNATQPDSPHVGDQLELFSRQEMRTPWRSRAEVEANLEDRTPLDGSGGDGTGS